MSDCVFCKIGTREIPAMIIYEDDEFVAFRDIAPKAPVHVIVMPRKHYSVLHDCNANDEGLLGRMLLVAAGVDNADCILGRGLCRHRRAIIHLIQLVKQIV